MKFQEDYNILSIKEMSEKYNVGYQVLRKKLILLGIHKTSNVRGMGAIEDKNKKIRINLRRSNSMIKCKGYNRMFTGDDIKNIFSLRDNSGLKAKEIAQKYHVARSTITMILLRKTYKYVLLD